MPAHFNIAGRTYLDVDTPVPHVLRVCINNPSKKNALSRATMRDLADIIHAADAHEDVWILLLASKVQGVFSSGADVSSDITDPAEGFDDLARAVYSFKKLFAVAINGLSVGVAVTLTAHADLAWCTAGSKFFTPFGRLALVPEFASSLLFPLRMGRPLATQVLLAGKALSSDDALRCGLVASILPTEEALEAEALTCAATIVGQHAAQRSITTFKRLLRGPPQGDSDVLWAHTEELRELRARFTDGEPLDAVMRFFTERQAARDTAQAGASPRL